MVRDLRGWIKVRGAVLGRDGGRCVLCGSGERLEVDHVRPVFLGGGNELANLRSLCRACHRDRSRWQLGEAAMERQARKQPKKAVEDIADTPLARRRLAQRRRYL